jgi:hypothetical protein
MFDTRRMVRAHERLYEDLLTRRPRPAARVPVAVCAS